MEEGRDKPTKMENLQQKDQKLAYQEYLSAAVEVARKAGEVRTDE